MLQNLLYQDVEYTSAPEDKPEVLVIGPQAGKQEEFLASDADIVIYGGSAGSGKTYGELLDALRHLDNPEVGVVIFRRTYPEITNEGGLWDESQKLFPLFKGKPNQGSLWWTFPSGLKVTFRHLQHEKNVHAWQGAQIPVILFDELTHFTFRQFWYLVSRNRSATAGIKPYVRGTCNPDPDSWVATFIEWWIDQKTGYPIEERSGVVRWFVREKDEIKWADTRVEAIDLSDNPEEADPKSVTFISATIYDNPALLKGDPTYLSNLRAQPEVDQEQLLKGNWKIRPAAGSIFNRYWFEIVDLEDIPKGGTACRFWDFAATERKMKIETGALINDPSYTASVLMIYVKEFFYIIDLIALQKGPAEIDELFKNVAFQDWRLMKAQGRAYMLRWEEEGGASGKRDSYRLSKMVAGLDCLGVRPDGDKIIRAKPMARQAKLGRVKLVSAAWNERFLVHMHNQPAKKKDIMDGSSGAFNSLVANVPFRSVAG